MGQAYIVIIYQGSLLGLRDEVENLGRKSECELGARPMGEENLEK